nr:RNA-directed DNA polymerase, eukaryota, reverse transcriptase zinc-binding domain protein [Tanacetum cinerariifolium]
SWSEIIEGMEARLSRWKLKTLSIGGRLTLIKSVLGAINIYHMSMFKVPMQVLQKLESIRARFFNGTDVNSRKPIWVRWKSVMTSKDEVEALKMQGLDLLSFINPKLGSGLNTSFWDVPWRRDTAFKELAPRIYALESLKGISVAAKLSHGGLDQYLRRKPRGGAEQVQLELLHDLIHGCLLSNSNDRWSWSLDGEGDFTVSSVRKAIDNHILPKGTTKTRLIDGGRWIIGRSTPMMNVGGHSGVFSTTQRLIAYFYWMGLRKMVKEYDISMDFVESLPLSQGKTTILAVVDMLSKYAHFITPSYPYTAKQIAYVFLDNIYRLHAIKTTPYEILYGQPPPLHIPYVAKDSPVEMVDRTLQARQQTIGLLKFNLKKA